MRLLRENGHRLLRSWVDLVQKYRITALLITLLATVYAFNYTVENIGMNSGTKDMLSEDLRWRQLDLEYERHFPQYIDNILVVVEAGTPDQARDAARALYRRLDRHKDLFADIFYPGEMDYFRQSSLLFLDTGELQDLADNLATIQPFLSRLTEDQTLRGLFSMLSDAVDAMEDGEDIDIAPLVRQLNKTVTAIQDNRPYRVSWQQLMGGDEGDKPVYREYIVLQPVLDYSSLFPADDAIRALRKQIDDGRLDEIGASVHLTGSAMLSHEELQSVTRGTGLAFGLALCVVTVIMILGLGSIRLVAASLITLITGLIFTATFATAVIGELNLISVAFSVLYIGLGVAFAIHFCLRYRELLANHVDRHEAIDEASIHTGRSLFLCAMTTAIGFFAFIPTDYDGVAELGLISGAGMFIALAVTMTVLPSLLSLLPLKRPAANRSAGLPLPPRIVNFPRDHARSVRRATLILTIAAIALSTQIRFDYNPLNLQDQDNEAVTTFQSLLEDPDTSPWRGIIIADGKRDAVQTSTELEELSVVDDVLWLEDFIPSNQDEKLEIIEELSLLLYGLPGPDHESPPINAEQRFTSIKGFASDLQGSPLLDSHPRLAALHRSLAGYTEQLERMDDPARARSLERFSESVLASLPGRLETLRESLQARPVTAADLPPQLARRWHSEYDGYLLEITPAENLVDRGTMRRFVRDIRKQDDRLIGAPVINLEAGDAIVRAFTQAFLYAFVVITLFLFIVLEKKRDTAYILIPLVVAAAFTVATTVIFNMPFNFANIIALPLLLGIGVDSGIHILHRYRTTLPDHRNILITSTARAVVVSALTTMGSIGNLALSHHTGTASMGILLTIGIAVTLICMLVILPSLLAREE